MGTQIPRALSLPCPYFSSALNLAFSKVTCGRNSPQTGKSRLLMNDVQSSPTISGQTCPAEDGGLALGSCRVGDPRLQVLRTGREVSEGGRELVGSHVLQPEGQRARGPSQGCLPGSAALFASMQLSGRDPEPGLGELTAATAASVEGHRPAHTPKDTAPSGRGAGPGQGPEQQSPTDHGESHRLCGLRDPGRAEPQSAILSSSHS